MDGLLVAPISHRSIILGKVGAQTVRGLIQGFLILGLSMLFFGVQIYGSPIIMFIVLVLGTASFVGVGIILDCCRSRPRNCSNDDNASAVPNDVHQRHPIPNRLTPGLDAVHWKRPATILRSRRTAESDYSQCKPNRHHARRTHTHSLHVPNNDPRHTAV